MFFENFPEPSKYIFGIHKPYFTSRNFYKGQMLTLIKLKMSILKFLFTSYRAMLQFIFACILLSCENMYYSVTNQCNVNTSLKKVSVLPIKYPRNIHLVKMERNSHARTLHSYFIFVKRASAHFCYHHAFPIWRHKRC